MIRRMLVFLYVLSFAASAPLAAQTLVVTRGSEPAFGRFGHGAGSSRVPAETAVLLLNKRVERLEWDEKPFEEVIRWLRDEAEGQVNVLPRWNRLADEGIDPDTPVTLRLSNTTIGMALTEALDQMSEDGGLGFHAFGNMLKISTREDLDRTMYTRVYDVVDLLVRIPDFGETAPQIDLQQQQRQGGGGGGGGGQGVFAGGTSGQEQSLGGEQAEQELKQRLEEFRDAIQLTIAPESWSTTTGPQTGGRGSIAVFNRALIVTNTIDVHEQIVGYFAFNE